MVSRNQYLKNLTNNFNSNENIEFIIQQVFNTITSLKQIRIYEDDHFNNVFDEVATKVFNVESRKSGLIELDELNEIVIDQLVQYIDYNIADFDTEKVLFKKPSAKELSILERRERQERNMDVESISDSGDESKIKRKKKKLLNEIVFHSKKKKKVISISGNSKNSRNLVDSGNSKNLVDSGKVVSRINNKSDGIILNNENLSELNLDLDDQNTRFHLNNVKSISLKVVDIVNSDYLINNNNNYFVFKILLQPKTKVLYSQDFTITLPEGNYTYESLLNEIKLLMNNCIGDINFKFDIKIEELTGKIVLFTTKTQTEVGEKDKVGEQVSEQVSEQDKVGEQVSEQDKDGEQDKVGEQVSEQDKVGEQVSEQDKL